jgi:diguanylate cyclase (GGDEF)-like protein
LDWPKGFKTGRFAPRPLILLVVLVCAGLAASVGAFLDLRASERNRQQTALEQGAAERFGALQKVINEDLLALELLGRFYVGSQKVERNEFYEFTKPIPKHLSCLQALEWAPRVRETDRTGFEAEVRKAGFAGFEITERDADSRTVRASRRDEYFPVDFIEPAEGNEPARGFDLASSPGRREAMEQARDTGEMRGTAPVRLVQETGDQAGVLVLLPVYRNGTPTESVEDRRANLEGFVLGVFRIGDLVERALAPLTPHGIDVALYDMSAPAGKRLLTWHPSRLRREVAEAPDEADVRLPETVHYAASLRPAGRTWLVLCTPSPEFVAGAGRWQPWEALGIGLAFTALLAGYFATTLRRTAQIKSLARFPSETPDPVLRIARNGEVLYANVSAAGILELPGAAPEAVRGAAQQAFASGKQVTFEVADADRIFSFSSSLPVSDGDYVNLYGHDITERKRAEEALEEAKRKLEELATTDALTGLANRRRFMEVLEAEFRRSRRYGGRLALAMVDVDRFKSFNDAHGHAFGDRVLVEVAKRLAAEARQTDVVARLGGDEFVVLMPETSADEAVRAAERIRQILSLHPVSDGEQSVLATVSVGIGTVQNAKAGTPESLLKQADDAMYAAKEAGRNRVCLAPSEKAVSPAQ